MLAAGDRIPDVQVWLAPREAVSLHDLVSEGAVLVFFYLFDWSGTWTNEMELLRDRGREFEAAGVRVMAASRDSAWSHVAWMQALDIDFPLLSDWNGDAVRGFGVGQDYRGMTDVPRRSAFLIDSSGTVRGAWTYEDGELPDLDELLSAAQALS